MLEHILSWDRSVTLFINGSHSLLWDQVIYLATSTFAWIMLGVLILWLISKNTTKMQFFTVVSLLVLGVFVSDQLSSSVFKPLFLRWRPTNDPIYMYSFDTVHNYRGGKFGFFSAHASNTFTVCTFLCLLFKRRVLNVLMISWALLNCYTRLYLGVHYLGDILVGIIFGISIGYAIYRIYVKTSCNGIVPKMSLLNVKSSQIMSCSILLNYCLIFIFALFYWI